MQEEGRGGRACLNSFLGIFTVACCSAAESVTLYSSTSNLTTLWISSTLKAPWKSGTIEYETV